MIALMPVKQVKRTYNMFLPLELPLEYQIELIAMELTYLGPWFNNLPCMSTHFFLQIYSE